MLTSDWDIAAPFMRYSTLTSGAHTTLRLSGFLPLSRVPLSLTVYTATSAQLNGPDGVAVDNVGNLFISDYSRVWKVNAPTGIIAIVAGYYVGFSGDGGPATSAQFNYPYGLAVDSTGNLFIADVKNHRIRKVNAPIPSPTLTPTPTPTPTAAPPGFHHPSPIAAP